MAYPDVLSGLTQQHLEECAAARQLKPGNAKETAAGLEAHFGRTYTTAAMHGRTGYFYVNLCTYA